MDGAGAVAPDALPEAGLIAVQQVNNETGVIQPLTQIAGAARAQGAVLLADCAQGAGKLPLPDADMIAIAGHKLGAPAGIGALAPELRARVSIVQQARGEDEARVREAYAQLGVQAEVASFFKDLPQRIADAHLVVSRAGASTVCELAVIGRPAILVPYPFALDQDQAANAAELAASGAVIVIRQPDFTPERVAAEIAGAFTDPEGLTRRAGAAKSAGVPDAAARLADLVMATAQL